MPREDYVVVNNAYRERIIFSGGGFLPIKVERDRYKYRDGNLGLLDREVVTHFAHRGKKDNSIDAFFTPHEDPRSGLITIANYRPVFDTGELPVVMYDINLANSDCSSHSNGYFIVPLLEAEFMKVEANFSKIKKVARVEETYFDGRQINSLDDQYRHLKALPILMRGRYNQMAVELSRRMVSDEDISNKLELEKTMDNFRKTHPITFPPLRESPRFGQSEKLNTV